MVGLVVLTAAVRAASPPLFLVGGAISGVGTAFKGGRPCGESLTGLFLSAYLGLPFP